MMPTILPTHRTRRSVGMAVESIAATAMAAAAASVLLVGTAPRADAFGTIGHLAEHERITRAALACGTPNGGADCFEPRSLDQVAGKKGTFGAVGSPDNPLTAEILTSAAHCDNADYVAGPDYSAQDRQRATAALLACVDHARRMVRAGVQRAGAILDSQGRIKPKEVSLRTSVIPPHPADCSFNRVSGRAKCDVIEDFGRALHAMQDFYSHSNWSDEAASGATGVHNPPGGGQGVISPLFALFGPAPSAADVPGWLTTGCFDAKSIPGEKAGCDDGGRTRLKHAWINKDHGVIDPGTGATTCTENGKNVCTARGRVGENFARAVRRAIDDTRRQWRDFAAAVRQAYPGQRGDRIVCALDHDDPVKTCH